MKISKIREVKTPTRGTECSAGLDFYVPKGFTARLTSGTDILVPSGIRVEVPHGYALIAMNRSSVATSTDAMRRVGLTPKANTPKGTLVVGACVVDEDYQGEIYIHLINVGRSIEVIHPGMKVAQLQHFASKAILVKALTRCLKKTEAVRGLRERWINNKR